MLSSSEIHYLGVGRVAVAAAVGAVLALALLALTTLLRGLAIAAAFAVAWMGGLVVARVVRWLAASCSSF